MDYTNTTTNQASIINNPLGVTSIIDSINNNNYILNYTQSQGFQCSEDVYNILETIPLIGKIIEIKPIANSATIKFNKVSHSNYTKIFFYEGCLIVGNSPIYGVYDKKYYEYWRDQITIEFESESSIKNIKPGDYICNYNCFDWHITNEEIRSFVKDFQIYNNYAHNKLEARLESKEESLSCKINAHKELDKCLINI